MTRRKPKTAIYYAGEHGVNRVWVFKRGGSDALYLGWYEEPIPGQRSRKAKSLGSITLAEAKREAEELASQLRRDGTAPKLNEITLGELFEFYHRERTPLKSRSAQDHDRRASALFLRCWGQTRLVTSLRPIDWDHYVNVRGSGALAPAGRSSGPVRARVLEQDMAFIRAVIGWALHNELIDREPMAGCKIPREKNVNRPMLFEEEYLAMTAVASEVHPRCRIALLLAHETGHRSQAVRLLRWSDIDLAQGRIRWRAEHDKGRREHIVPISKQLLEELRQSFVEGEDWLFPSDRIAGEPIGRELMESWWREMEDRAGIPRIKGRGWHSLRRKFATERKQGSLADLAYAGGWNGTQTLTTVYIQPDEASIREVVSSRAPVRRAPISTENGH